MDRGKRLINFSAGPCQLPVEVLEDVQRELVNFRGWGLSVMEMSHRGSHFKKVLAEAKETARSFLELPETHSLCFMSGGATAQFAAQALNLLPPNNPQADYAVTGYWSKMAMTEGEKYGTTRAVTDASISQFTEIKPVAEWSLNKEAAYLHYCDNETIHGIEFPDCPSVKHLSPRTLLVADLASNMGTKPIQWQHIDLAYAGAQKNIGIAGVTLVAINREILGRERRCCPMVMSYKKIVEADSCLNTPPCLNIHITGATLKHLKKQGDLAFWDRQCNSKSDVVYRHCDSSNGFFTAPVKPPFRSRVTVRIDISANKTRVEQELTDKHKEEECRGESRNGAAVCTPQNEEEKQMLETAKEQDKMLTKLFVEKAEENDMICLNGHRSLGGLRVCVFSGVSVHHIEKLLSLMTAFQEEHAVV